MRLDIQLFSRLLLRGRTYVGNVQVACESHNVFIQISALAAVCLHGVGSFVPPYLWKMDVCNFLLSH